MRLKLGLGSIFSFLIALFLFFGCESSTPPQKIEKAEKKNKKKVHKKEVDKKKEAPKGAKPKKDQKKPAPKKPKADDPQARLANFEKEQSLVRSRESAYINHLIKTAKNKINNHEYNSAKLFLDQAIGLDPANKEANKLRNQIGSFLGEPERRAENLQTNYENYYDVKKQQAKIEASNHYKKGMLHLQDKKYDKAIQSFESCLEIIKWAPYELNATALRRRSESRIKEAQRAKERWLTKLREEKIREAQQEAERLEREEQKRKHTQIRILLTRATEFFARKKFDKASELIEEVLEVDPTNRIANKLKRDIRDAKHANIAASTLSRKIENWKQFLEDMDESAVPYSKHIMFPDKDDWHGRINKRKDALTKGLGLKTKTDEVSANQKEVLTKLESIPITLSFSETPFQDVIRFIQTTANINIVVDPKVIQNFEIEGKKVTLNVQDLKLKTALDILLQFHNLIYIFKNDVLFITSKDSDLAKGKSIPVLHDIRDLTGQIKDFPGPKIRLDAGSGNDSGGAVFEDQEDGGGAVLTGEKLTDLIKASINPDSWDKEDNSIAETSGQLLVVNTEEVQEQVRRFLSDMRRFSGMMVTIESRFLVVTDGFLETFGIDWRGVGDNNLRANDPNDQADDNLVVLPAVTRGADDFSGDEQVNQDNVPDVDKGFVQSVRPAAGAFFQNLGKTDVRARNENVNQEAVGNLVKNTGGLAMQFAFLGEFEFNAVLRAVRKNAETELMQTPRITTFNTQRANLTIINQISFIKDFDVEVAQSAYVADPVIGTIQEGVVLDVKPTISNDRKYITLELRPTLAQLVGDRFRIFNASLGGQENVTFQFPQLELQSVETTVRIPDEGSILIGGFNEFRESDHKQDLPLVGDIPVLGFFFSQRSKSKEKKQTVILIKAKIIDLEEEEELAVGLSR